MAKKILPSVEDIREILHYDAATGLFYWKERGKHFFQNDGKFTQDHRCAKWNSRFCGKEAFTAIDGNGYKQGRILGISVLAHRVAWAIYHGEWPSSDQEIDHINMIKSDNRIANIRIAERGQNKMNRRVQSNSKSGIKGVVWQPSRQKWQAQIQLDGRFIFLGRFKDKYLAMQAYNDASVKYHGEFARTK